MNDRIVATPTSPTVHGIACPMMSPTGVGKNVTERPRSPLKIWPK
ncbi:MULTISPECIES: hypothetical protein [unclassified Pseudonocardia]|nr:MULTISPECIES: hypothetical protein [unclassified Pseudonocardia]